MNAVMNCWSALDDIICLLLVAEEEMKRSKERFAGSYAAVGFQYETPGAEDTNGDQQGQGRNL